MHGEENQKKMRVNKYRSELGDTIRKLSRVLYLYSLLTWKANSFDLADDSYPIPWQE